jgi:ketosteroid isomerase-like protein
MNNTLLLLLFIPLAMCQGQQRGGESALLDTLLNRWHAAAAAADADGVFSFMSADAVYLGTDASERWTKEEFRQFCQPYFEQGRGWSFTPLRRSIRFSASGEIAWFDEQLDTWMGTCFGSGVLSKENGRWQLRQYHLAFTVPNARMRDVLKLLGDPEKTE